MEILLMIIHIIALIVLVICLIALGWYLYILKEQKQEKGGYITLDGDVEADSRYYYIRVFKSDKSVEHLKVPRFNSKYALDASTPSRVKIIIKKNSL